MFIFRPGGQLINILNHELLFIVIILLALMLYAVTPSFTFSLRMASIYSSSLF